MANRKQELTETEIRIHLLLRDMRETIQYAYDASECLDAAVNRYAGNMRLHFKRAVQEMQPQLAEALRLAQERVYARTEELRKQIEDVINNFAGVKTSDELVKAIGAVVTEAISKDMTAELARIGREQISPAVIRAVVKDEIMGLVGIGRNATAESVKAQTVDILKAMREQTAAEIRERLTDGRD